MRFKTGKDNVYHALQSGMEAESCDPAPMILIHNACQRIGHLECRPTPGFDSGIHQAIGEIEHHEAE